MNLNKKAFTLIEILAAISILGIISAFVFVQMNAANNSANDAKREMDLELLKNAVVAYQNDHQRLAPIEATTCYIGSTCTNLDSSIEPYLSSLPTDPEPGAYYLYQSSADGSDCTITAMLSTGESYQYDCSEEVIAPVVIVTGECGIDNEEVLSSTPTFLCNQGTASSVIGEGPWFWSCDSENGGLSDSCIAFISGEFTCTVTNGSCDGVTMFKMYDPTGGHAELSNQSAYNYKVCCEGNGLTNSCSGSYATVLKLYSETNSHVEINTESNYTNSVCLSAAGRTATCSYATNCSSLGEGYECLASISEGSTSLHVGNCTDAYSTKVCCELAPY
jgi:prepilin-type N-terminal cleavage/methylation domain-containing protein